MDWLPQTKFVPPLPRDDLIARDLLLQKLRSALLAHPLTLISTPAGYGKATLLSMAIGELGDASAVWMTIDEDDNDPVQFFGALLAALRGVDPDFGAATSAMLDNLTTLVDSAEAADATARFRRVVGVLANELAAAFSAPLVLCLDDLHVVSDPTVHLTLGHMLERLPASIHLAVTTRHDPPLPLPRMRARGQLAEFRLPDLRFSSAESAALLNEALHLDLSSTAFEALSAQTEGWPAGLRLLAGKLDRIGSQADRLAFIHELAQTDRTVFEFLAQEVLAAQEPELRAFLLDVSILRELTPELCAAVTQREDAGMLLEEVYRRNLFLVAIELSSETYRLHELFRKFLQQQLKRKDEQRMHAYHRRAGEALQGDPARAIHHLLAAQAWEAAADSLEQISTDYRQSGRLDNMRIWIEALPESTLKSRPQLLYVLVVAAWQRYQLETAQTQLEAALHGFEATGDEVATAEVLADLATCALMLGDFGRSEELTQRALSGPAPTSSRLQLHLGRVYLAIFFGDLAAAQRDLDAVEALLAKPASEDTLRTLALYADITFSVVPGGVRWLERVHALCVAQFGREVSLARLVIEILGAFLHFTRGRFDSGFRAAEQTLTISQQFGGYSGYDSSTHLILASSYAGLGEYEKSHENFEAYFRTHERVDIEQTFTPGIKFQHARTYWLQNDTQAVRDIYAELQAIDDVPDALYLPALVDLLQGLLHISSAMYAEAEEALRRAVELTEMIPMTSLFGDARVMLAHLYRLTERPDEALATLRPVLAARERDDAPGIILMEGQPVIVPLLQLAVEHGVHANFAARLLALLDVKTPTAASLRIPITGEVLTPREVEVLRLLAERATNREIAAQLHISLPTVKSHVAHVLQKLDVDNRLQAGKYAVDHLQILDM